MNIIILACSLNPKSRSFQMSKFTQEYLSAEDNNINVELLDLRETPLPFCDGGACYADERVWALQGKIKKADLVIFSVPIYNYEINSAAKNLIDLAGDALKNKTIGFMAAAGGESSYMSLLPTISSMMLQHRALIVPRYVYASYKSFSKEGELIDDTVKDRLKDLVNQGAELASMGNTILEKFNK